MLFGPMTPERRASLLRLAVLIGMGLVAVIVVGVASQFESSTKEVFVQE